MLFISDVSYALCFKVEFWKGVPQKGVLYRQVMVDPTSKDLVLVVEGLEKFGKLVFFKCW